MVREMGKKRARPRASGWKIGQANALRLLPFPGSLKSQLASELRHTPPPYFLLPLPSSLFPENNPVPGEERRKRGGGGE